MITSLDSHIEISNDVCGGKPRITGRRITVHDIVIWHERLGKSVDEIASDYDLTLGDVYAALAYYFDNRLNIDEQIEKSELFVNELKKNTPPKVDFRLSK